MRWKDVVRNMWSILHAIRFKVKDDLVKIDNTSLQMRSFFNVIVNHYAKYVFEIIH